MESREFQSIEVDSREKHRIVLHVYDEESKEFTSLTTYHGMIRIYASDTWPSRIFWCLVVITCLVFFLLHSGRILVFYHSHPTFRKFTDEPLKSEDLPFVTICKENGFNERYFSENNISEKDLEVAFRVMRQEFLTVDEYKILKNIEKQKKITVESLYTNLTLSCPDLLIRLKVSGQKLDPCQFAREDLTEFGVCWTIGEWPAKRSDDRLEIIISNREPSANIVVHVHSRWVQPSVIAKGLYLPKNRVAHLIVQPKIVDFLEIGSWGTCSKEWNPRIRLHENYTLTNCFRYCMAEQFLTKCGCVPYHLKAFGNRICSLEEMYSCRKPGIPIVRCQCKPQCNRPRYIVQRPTYLQVAPKMRNTSILRIDFPSNKLIRVQQFKRFTSSDLLSYVAGSMSLFLGMSCVTLLEIFMFLFKVIWGTFNDDRHKSFFDKYLENETKNRIPHLRQKIIIASRENSQDEENWDPTAIDQPIIEENIKIVFDEKRRASIYRMPDSVIMPENKRVRSATGASNRRKQFHFGLPDATNQNTRRRLSHFPGIGF